MSSVRQPSAKLREADLASRIAARNDAFRRDPSDGMLVLTRRLSATSWIFRCRLIEAVQADDSFTPDNDPYGEHDFGVIVLDGQKLFWKIDVFATPECFDAADPLDPDAFRVLTVMHPEDW